MAIFAVTIPFAKLAVAIDPKKIFWRWRLKRNPALIRNMTQKEIIDIYTKPPYDFASNIEDIVYYLFPTLAFYYIADIYLTALCIVGYILALLSDKYIMIKFCSPVTTGGLDLGLEFYRLLAWDIRIQILTLACVPPAIIDEDYPVW
eukprot:CAMPEP_0114581726 /NCGR_PEP_ID=MMETSP0125-20121206/5803_1 /TAXON_ID=485358 ORGANISM="Aristerostoma sp., Strain ATCC 50986" /NCGR_SAMPLE_ID=MMETSP0125 /ASSEMBLY_ACC=CAM_ASM_000245 /LENGTH=146 /DNA_ID=CAMNT_0001774159 /DNA_START=1518 /DNA_END=1955 /DNA_ORIENTATION=-